MMSKMLTPREVAERLSIGYDRALAFIRYSGVPFHKIGRQYRVDEKALETFLLKKGTAEIALTDEKD